ncbi:MAG: DUF4105 domain-containing protein [Lentisphaerae bacterium]|nr:DUF4105 domain-containing protein [Lentisphaerota bacterium]
MATASVRITRRLAFLAAWTCWSAAVAPAQDTPAYADELVATAEALELSADPTWLNLLHYQPTLMGGYCSLVDDPAFFNARDGKTNPRHELSATLRAFFRPASTNDLEHPVCRFVARFDWLQQKLAFDPSCMPVPACTRFDDIRTYLAATSVTLVFPAAYMNGPASMFGHTLLVFDSEGKNRLLSRAVSYAAKTDQSIGPLFAFAGIAGLYPGYYAIQPYYDKVEQYGDIGHRDVWEYELTFTPAEVDRMVRHAWELQNIWSRYYFFDENCAYNLYYFLDVARPELRLSAQTDWFVIPIDTVKAVQRAGLVRHVYYRPSAVSRIRHLASSMEKRDRLLARGIAQGRTPPAEVTNRVANTTNQIAVLELASAYTQYLYTEELLPRAAYTPRFMDTLRVRSKLGRLPDALADVPEPPRPDLGHAPLRLSAGVGLQKRDAYSALRGRIAYHALLDNDAGYDPGAEIQFANTEARYFPERDQFVLEQCDVVDVQSIAPRDEFFRPGSWKFSAGLTQAHVKDKSDNVLVQAQTAAGLGARTPRKGLAFAWIEARGLSGGGLGGADYAVGTGPAAGFVTRWGPRCMQLIEARATYFGVGNEFWDYQVNWGQDVQLKPNRSVSLEATAARRNDEDRQDVQLRLNTYF